MRVPIRPILAGCALLGVALLGLRGPAAAQDAAASGNAAAQAENMQIIGHTDLGGHGNGGEGLAMHCYPDGRRVLFLAHESGPACFSVVDVTQPENPRVIRQVPVESPDLRCNSLGLSGTTLAVARQSAKPGQPGGGMTVYDVADPAQPRQISHLDTSGPHSRGVHFLWFADGRTAYLSTGAADFTPTNPLDDQFLMLVDMADPAHPHEAGRWWFPGTRQGDAAPPPPRVRQLDNGYRMHTLAVDPARPDRAYVGWIDGGLVILDIADRAHPRLVSQNSWISWGLGFFHTALPLPGRPILIQSDEATQDNCADAPKRVVAIDIRDERHPFPLAPMPPPADQDALCRAGGRSGSHNLSMNRPGQRILRNTVVAAMFNAGIRAYSVADPNRPVEIGHLIPAAPPGSPAHTAQMNDVFVDEDGLIYGNDRFTGGLYVIRYTGSVPLD